MKIKFNWKLSNSKIGSKLNGSRNYIFDTINEYHMNVLLF